MIPTLSDVHIAIGFDHCECAGTIIFDHIQGKGERVTTNLQIGDLLHTIVFVALVFLFFVFHILLKIHVVEMTKIVHSILNCKSSV